MEYEKRKTNISEIPLDVLQMCFDFMDARSVLSFSSVSRELYDMYKSVEDDLWSNKCKLQWNLDLGQMKSTQGGPLPSPKELYSRIYVSFNVFIEREFMYL